MNRLGAILLGWTLPWAAASTNGGMDSALGGMLEFTDYRLEYHCRGEGTPVLYLESPSGLSAAEAFAPVFPALAERSRVCRLERLGFGGSDAPLPGLVQTAADYADELHELVSRMSPDERIVIIGYSFGGFIARIYAHRYPERVAGLVLIDAAHEEWFRAMKRQMAAEDWARLQEVFDWFVDHLGHDAWTSQFEVEQTRLDPDLPFVAVSRGLDHERLRLTGMSDQAFRIANDLHDYYQHDLARLTENTTHVVAQDSEHLIVDSEPEIVLAAIDRLLGLLRADGS
jgi:pimeloyl-ACP methyl ester carboxylesterase